MKLAEAFGTVLQRERGKLGFSQEEFAHSCDLDRTYISLLERGLRQPTLQTIFTIAAELNISPEALVRSVQVCLKKGKRKNVKLPSSRL